MTQAEGARLASGLQSADPLDAVQLTGTRPVKPGTLPHLSDLISGQEFVSTGSWFIKSGAEIKNSLQAQIPAEDKNEADKTDPVGSERGRDGRGGSRGTSLPDLPVLPPV